MGEGQGEGQPKDVRETPTEPGVSLTGADYWKARAMQLAKTGAADGSILAVLRYEARGKWPIEQIKKGLVRWVRRGWIDDARAAGVSELDEALRKTALGDGREAATSAIYLAKRGDTVSGMDPELRKLLKELSGLSGKELKRRAAAVLGELEG